MKGPNRSRSSSSRLVTPTCSGSTSQTRFEGEVDGSLDAGWDVVGMCLTLSERHAGKPVGQWWKAQAILADAVVLINRPPVGDEDIEVGICQVDGCRCVFSTRHTLAWRCRLGWRPMTRTEACGSKGGSPQRRSPSRCVRSAKT